MSTHTNRHYIPRGKERAFFVGLKKLVREAGIKTPARLWRIQLMAQPNGSQPAYGEVYLTHDDEGGRS